MPISRDMAIFVLTIMTTINDTTDYFTLCACARGNYYLVQLNVCYSNRIIEMTDHRDTTCVNLI